jgi:hypothetical protein
MVGDYAEMLSATQDEVNQKRKRLQRVFVRLIDKAERVPRQVDYAESWSQAPDPLFT